MIAASSRIVPEPAATPPHNGFSLISNQKLLELYSTMLKCHLLHARIRSLTLEDKSIESRAASSQKALAVAVALDLLPGDTLAPSPGGLIPSFVKGLPLRSIFSVLTPKAAARPRYAPLNLIPPSLSLAAQLNRAIAAAAAHKKSRNKKIAVAFCGNSSDSPDLLQDAMRQAGKRNLPILLVCLIPLTYLTTCWQFTLPLIIDKQLSLGAAMKTSWQQVNRHWWHVFGLTMLAYLIVFLGVLGCGVGILFTIPIGIAIVMYGYETIFSAKAH